MRMIDTTKNLFTNLTFDELELTSQLQAIIREEINQSNNMVIPFSKYMELALYYPSLGYYCNPLFKFGAKGDFITAPLVSNLFGFMLSRQFDEIFNFGVRRNILEFGAGNGKLAADILSTIGEQIESYYILELSANLVAWQKETLYQRVPSLIHKVVWLDTLPDEFEGIIFANEVLDAQPCNLIKYVDGNVQGVGVSYENDQFIYAEYDLDSNTKEIADNLNLDYHDYITEIHTANIGFINSIANCLTKGAVLLIDYGVGEREYYHPQKARGSLRGFFRQHVLDDVLQYPGIIDITSSVNWTSIATTGINSGLELIGFTNQGSFLLNCGLTDLLDKLKIDINEAQYLNLSNQVNKLTSQNEMGDLFKICGFSKNIEQDSWVGFLANDKTYTL